MVTGPVVAPLVRIDPFVELERISALMDQQAAAMMRQVENLQGGMNSEIASRGQRVFLRIHDVGERRVHEERADHLQW